MKPCWGAYQGINPFERDPHRFLYQTFDKSVQPSESEKKHASDMFYEHLREIIPSVDWVDWAV